MVFVLTHDHDCADDGYTIEGVFSSFEELEEYVKQKHPQYKLDEKNGWFVLEHKNHPWFTKEFLNWQEFDVDVSTRKN